MRWMALCVILVGVSLPLWAQPDAPDTVPALIKDLTSPDYLTRTVAFNILGELKDPRAVEPLMRLAVESSDGTRSRAVMALGRIGDPRAIPTLLACLPVANQIGVYAWAGLRRMPADRVIAALRADLTSADPARQAGAILAAALWQQEVPMEVQQAALASSKPAVRAAILEYRIVTGVPGAMDTLLATVDDPDPAISLEAIDLLRMHHDPRTVDRLLPRLPPEIFSNPGQGVWSTLRTFDDPRIVDCCLTKLAEKPLPLPFDDSRAEALAYLAEHPTSRALPVLVRCITDPAIDMVLDARKVVATYGPAAAEAVLPLLRAKDAKTRAAAAEVLGRTGDARALQPLITTLRDPSPLVRQAAAFALENMGDTRAESALITALSDREPNVAFAAAGALNGTQNPAAVAPLIKLVEKSPSNWDLLQTLSGMEDPRAQAKVRTVVLALKEPMECRYLTDVVDHLWAGSWPRDPQMIAAFLACLKTFDNELLMREFLRETLFPVRMTPLPVAARAALVKGLEDFSPTAHFASATALLHDREYQGRALRRLLTTTWERDGGFLREETAQAIAASGAAALEPLREASTAPEAQVRGHAAACYGYIAADLRAETLAPLTALLRDPDSGVRLAAAAAFAHRDPAEAADPLLDAFKAEQHAMVREQLASTFGALRIRAAVPLLCETLSTRVFFSSAEYCNALGEIGDPAAIPALQRVIAQTPPRLRSLQTLRTLRPLPGRSFDNPEYAANLALAKLGVRDVLPVLRREMADTPEYIQGLGYLRDTASVEALIALVQVNSWESGYAIEALGQIGDPRGLEAMLVALRNREWLDGMFREQILSALAAYPDPQGGAALRKALSDAHWPVRVWAALALGKRTDPADLPLLRVALTDPQSQVRAAAARALGERKDVDARAALNTAVKDAYPEVRRAAAEALIRMP